MQGEAIIMKIGVKIKQLRTDNGLTLKQLSEITKLSISFISDIENGRRNPSLENLNILASALGIFSEALISDSKDYIPNENLHDNSIPVLDDPQVRALARRSLDKNPEKQALLKKLIKSMLEED
jgi:transcriptional regulator with XRE-family HTH domain